MLGVGRGAGFGKTALGFGKTGGALSFIGGFGVLGDGGTTGAGFGETALGFGKTGGALSFVGGFGVLGDGRIAGSGFDNATGAGLLIGINGATGLGTARGIGVLLVFSGLFPERGRGPVARQRFRVSSKLIFALRRSFSLM